MARCSLPLDVFGSVPGFTSITSRGGGNAQTAQRLAAELNVPVSCLYEPDDDLAELIRLLGGRSRDQLRQLITQLQTLPSA